MMTSCDGITWTRARNAAPCRPRAHQGGDMTIETLDRPIEPESAIMKGN
jgi:hypothetical protein